MRKTHTSKQTSKCSTHTFRRIFWKFFNINKQNSFRRSNKRLQCINNTMLSTTPNTYDESRNNTNTTPTAPQLKNLNHNHPLSLVPRNFRNLALTDLINSRSNYPQSPIQHIVTQQPNIDDTYEPIIKQPHTTNFRSQDNHFFLPTMSLQVGSLHRSISYPANLQNNLPIIPLFAFPHLYRLIITLYPIWNQILIPTQQYLTLSSNSTTPISKHPTNLPTLNPVHLLFPNLPFNLSILKSKLNPFPLSLPFYMLHPYSPLTSEPSDNNDEDHTQISHEIDNFITLQQQLQHAQTLTIHQLSRSLTSSNPSTPTPSSTYTPSQNPTSPSTPSSSINRTYRTFKRNFPNTPFPSNPGTPTRIVNHSLHTNTKDFLQLCLPFFPQYTYFHSDPNDEKPNYVSGHVLYPTLS